MTRDAIETRQAGEVRRVGALIIGDEILSGKRRDKHLVKLIEILGERGLALSWARYLGDDHEMLAEALEHLSGDLADRVNRAADLNEQALLTTVEVLDAIRCLTEQE